MPVGDLIKKINQKLRGHYQYYGVTDNTRSVKSFLNTTNVYYSNGLIEEVRKGVIIQTIL